MSHWSQIIADTGLSNAEIARRLNLAGVRITDRAIGMLRSGEAQDCLWTTGNEILQIVVTKKKSAIGS